MYYEKIVLNYALNWPNWGLGWRKWSKTCQSYAAEMQDLMANINPLLDIVGSLGAPYSGAAIGTLTAFFAVCITWPPLVINEKY